MRLKLNTPLQVSDLLFAAAEEILASERKAAEAETRAATGVGDAMEAYADAMSEDFGAQLDAVRQCVLRSVARCDDVLDSTLRLTNAAELFTAYVLGNGGGAARRGRNRRARRRAAELARRSPSTPAGSSGTTRTSSRRTKAPCARRVLKAPRLTLGSRRSSPRRGDEEGTREDALGPARVTNPKRTETAADLGDVVAEDSNATRLGRFGPHTAPVLRERRNLRGGDRVGVRPRGGGVAHRGGGEVRRCTRRWAPRGVRSSSRCSCPAFWTRWRRTCWRGAHRGRGVRLRAEPAPEARGDQGQGARRRRGPPGGDGEGVRAEFGCARRSPPPGRCSRPPRPGAAPRWRRRTRSPRTRRGGTRCRRRWTRCAGTCRACDRARERAEELIRYELDVR